GYYAALAGLGCAVDAWETTYLHRLEGEDPVLDWVMGTGLRPVLAALEDAPQARVDFLFAYRDALRAALDEDPVIQNYRAYVDAYGLGWKVEENEDLTLAAYNGSTALHYAGPTE
ncbi:hypothetical protein K6C39_23110, partial [Vibrio vulnificus]|nr:hypothetical protein [Vibrio vulnificus]